MYTATVKNKEIIKGQMNITVDFSDGTTTITEKCIPQDRNGFVHWVKSRLSTFNSATEIDTDYSINTVVDLSEPVPPAPTAGELAKQAWFADYLTLQDVQKLIDLGVLTGTEPKVVSLRNKVKNNFKPEYLSLI